MPKNQQLGSMRMTDLQEYFFARANEKIAALKKSGKQIVNLGMGNPDLPPPAEVVECLRTESLKPENNLYPSYTGLPEFRKAIADWYAKYYQIELDPDTQVLPLNGSKQGIVYFTLSVVGSGDEVLIPNPGYATYEKAAVIAGATSVFYELNPENTFLPDLEKLQQRDLSKVKLMWINYPHNPTGATLTLTELQKIAEFARERGIILVNDNPYSHITFAGYSSPSLLQCSNGEDLFVELSSMSKTYNMPGWRIGWIAGNTRLISLVKNIYGNIETGQFIPLQKAATLALSLPQTWIDERNKIYAERRNLVISLLEKLHCEPFPSRASLYVWAKLPADITNAEDYIFSLLEDTGIFLAPGTAFGINGEGFVRAALCQPKELVAEALQRVRA